MSQETKPKSIWYERAMAAEAQVIVLRERVEASERLRAAGTEREARGMVKYNALLTEMAALRAIAEAAMRLLEVESSPGPAGRHFQAVALLRAALRRAGVDPAISRDRWFRAEGAAKE